MKKTLCMALVLVLAIGCLAGCGPKTTKNSGPVDLLLGLPGGDGVTPMSLVENFKAANPNINVTTDESSWGDFTQKVKLQFVSKSDVVPIFITDSAQAASFGAQGSLADLKERADKDLDASLYNKALYAVTGVDGQLWGVPHAMNSIAILYNKDIFDKYNVEYPKEDWTWADMMEMAKKLTVDENGDGKTDIFGIHYGSNITQGWLPFMAATGCDIFGPDKNKSNLTDPKAKEALLHYMEPVTNNWIPDNAFIATYGSVDLAFVSGKIAMYLCQSSGMKTINANAAEGFKYDAQIMPIGWNGKRTCIYVPNVWVMYSGAPEEVKDAAWEWVKYYMSEEGQMIVAKEGPSGYPIMKSALDTVSKNGVAPENKDVFYKGIDQYGLSLLENPVSSAANGVMNEITSKIRNKEITAATIDKEIPKYDKLLQDEFDFYFDK